MYTSPEQTSEEKKLKEEQFASEEEKKSSPKYLEYLADIHKHPNQEENGHVDNTEWVIHRDHEEGFLTGYIKTDLSTITEEQFTHLQGLCHGDFTYHARGWIGFDCGHSCDYTPAINYGGTYRSRDWVLGIITGMINYITSIQTA
jgi:hypothetical protein